MAPLPALLAWAAVIFPAAVADDVSASVRRPSAAEGDISALVQRSLQSQLARGEEEEESEDAKEDGEKEEGWPWALGSKVDDLLENRSMANYTVESSVKQHELGPMAYTKLGPVLGKDHGHYYLFAGLRYTEPTERFEVARPKKPWAPKIYDATQFRPVCAGAATFEQESEDCLRLNIWMPKTAAKKMPVIVYFHGGINQHGSGSEGTRQGDGITNSSKHPTIFINFNWRLGIFGWINLKGSNISQNLGLQDQQAALRWVNEHIAAFGGDPTRVTLQGQSEGCGAVLVHMVAPGSAGLFSRAVWHSPVADVWSRSTNTERTKFMLAGTKCKQRSMWSTVRCLKRKHVKYLWDHDWVAEELSRNVGMPLWVANFKRLASFSLQAKQKADILAMMGWHAEVDNQTLLGDPVELIRQGRSHNVSLLITVNPNETHGVLPMPISIIAELGLDYLLGNRKVAEKEYKETLEDQGIVGDSHLSIRYQMLTDKLWMCDIRSLAKDLAAHGSRTYVGMFAHAPKYSASGVFTNAVCQHGAACHADEMLYVLPQGPRGIHGKDMEGELAFSKRYSESLLAFVSGNDTEHPWVPFDAETQPVTFYKASGTFVVPRYRKEQCDVLDRYNSKHLPLHMQHGAN